MRPLVPCELVEDTKEYAQALRSMKCKFGHASPGNQCVYLARNYRIPFEYIYTVKFSANEANRTWEAVVWDPNVPAISDVIVSIDLEDTSVGKVALVADPADNTNPKPQPNKVEIVRSDNGEIPIPLCGIPNVALQHTRLTIVANRPYGVAIVRSRILPDHTRRLAASYAHDIGNFLITGGRIEEIKEEQQCMCSIC